MNFTRNETEFRIAIAPATSRSANSVKVSGMATLRTNSTWPAHDNPEMHSDNDVMQTVFSLSLSLAELFIELQN